MSRTHSFVSEHTGSAVILEDKAAQAGTARLFQGSSAVSLHLKSLPRLKTTFNGPIGGLIFPITEADVGHGGRLKQAMVAGRSPDLDEPQHRVPGGVNTSRMHLGTLRKHRLAWKLLGKRNIYKNIPN